LNGPIQNLLQHARDEEFDQRDLDASSATAFTIDLVRCVQDQEPGGVDFGAAYSDPFSDDLAARERLAWRKLPFGCSVAHQVKSPFANPDPAHAMVNAAGS